MMLCGSDVRQASNFVLRWFGSLHQIAPDAKAIVSNLIYITTMQESVGPHHCHLCVSEHGGPRTKAEAGDDDDAAALLELAEQMKEQGAASDRSISASRQQEGFACCPSLIVEGQGDLQGRERAPILT